MRYCTTDKATGLVVNVILWDGEAPYTPQDGLALIRSDNANIGDIYDPTTGGFITPSQGG